MCIICTSLIHFASIPLFFIYLYTFIDIMIINGNDINDILPIISDYARSTTLELALESGATVTPTIDHYNFMQCKLNEQLVKGEGYQNDYRISDMTIHGGLAGQYMLFHFTNQMELRKKYLEETRQTLVGQLIVPASYSFTNKANQPITVSLYPDTTNLILTKQLMPVITLMERLVSNTLDVRFKPVDMLKSYGC